jgi:hypothetical protein
VYLAVRGVRMGWNKLARTGSLDAAVTAGTTETSTQLAEVTR